MNYELWSKYERRPLLRGGVDGGSGEMKLEVKRQILANAAYKLQSFVFVQTRAAPSSCVCTQSCGVLRVSARSTRSRAAWEFV
jgi:hypothetical protein